MRLKFLLFNSVGFHSEIKEEKQVNCHYYAVSSRIICGKELSLPSNPIDTQLYNPIHDNFTLAFEKV